MSFVQSDNHKKLMTMSYDEKRAAAKSKAFYNDKNTPYLHMVYRYEDIGFPAIRCYLPIRFSKKVINLEEQYRIQCLICDAYMKRPAFRNYIDDHCDYVADPDVYIWVSSGFHESVVHDKVSTHFTIRLQKDVETFETSTGATWVVLSPAIHLTVDRHRVEIFKVTMVVEL